MSGKKDNKALKRFLLVVSIIYAVFLILSLMGLVMTTHHIYVKQGYFNATEGKLDVYGGWWMMYFATIAIGYFLTNAIEEYQSQTNKSQNRWNNDETKSS